MNCCHEKKERSEEEYKSLDNRLARIEGQIRGIRKMLSDSVYCPEILIQCAAVNSAINSFEKELLREHISTCVVDDIQSGKLEVVDELVETIRRIMK